jgi:hypothetical protein
MGVLAMSMAAVQRNLQQVQQMGFQCVAMWLLFAQA